MSVATDRILYVGEEPNLDVGFRQIAEALADCDVT